MRSKFILLLLSIVLFLSSCTKIKDIFIKPTPREVYSREFPDNDPTFAKWESEFNKSINDSLKINLPYSETVHLFPEEMYIYSYNTELKIGEVINIEVGLDSINARIFIDLYRQEEDTANSYEFVERNEPEDRHFEYAVEESGVYKIIIQPVISLQSRFSMIAYIMPSYLFPVAGKTNSAIQSFWGAPRDGGSRSHEGIDIFAARGTPVVATTDGWVSSTGDRGLGGKQVWLRSGLLSGKSLYYAHLDSVAVSMLMQVNAGDTLGFVGNTGNARTTSPHLHFGIYTGSGAVDPLPFVYMREKPQMTLPDEDASKNTVVVSSATANLRLSASTNTKIIGEAQSGDTLQLLGSTDSII